MTNVNLSAGKTAVDTLKEAQNIGKQLGGVVTDQQADMERNIQEQHRKRMQAKAQVELQAASEDFRAFDKYETEKRHQKEIEKLKAEAIRKYGKNAWSEIESVKSRIKKERDEEMKFMDNDRNRMSNLFWWCATAAALVTYFFKLYK
jgi:alpha-galactosidase/6-phospho-beta-glucosidase family protein